MGFFKDFKRDFAQAVNELIPESESKDEKKDIEESGQPVDGVETAPEANEAVAAENQAGEKTDVFICTYLRISSRSAFPAHMTSFCKIRYSYGRTSGSISETYRTNSSCRSLKAGKSFSPIAFKKP